ncbi:hypothetical protein BLNAU_12278 [Blattamonas nauphoetae]|uniref:Uncharacterized protein n=1 Tax=Blattamonas nauphoetae TaxID=2049346 RepID=A0ABQ9XRF1_9EUKA|nr:hypothetical protein BLNAU_12278 [Blattamonas nauphoetae]
MFAISFLILGLQANIDCGLPPIFDFEDDECECEVLCGTYCGKINSPAVTPGTILRSQVLPTTGYTPAMLTFGSSVFQGDGQNGWGGLRHRFGSYGSFPGGRGFSYHGSGYPYEKGSALGYSCNTPKSAILREMC